MKQILIYTLSLMAACTVLDMHAQTHSGGFPQDGNELRWKLSDGGRAIVWTPGTDIPHYDHVEMTGEKVSMVLRWGVDADGKRPSSSSVSEATTPSAVFCL